MRRLSIDSDLSFALSHFGEVRGRQKSSRRLGSYFFAQRRHILVTALHPCAIEEEEVQESKSFWQVLCIFREVWRAEVSQGRLRLCRDTRAEREKERWGEKKPLIVWFSSEITGSSAQCSPTFLITDQSRRPSTYSSRSLPPSEPSDVPTCTESGGGSLRGIFFTLAHTQAHEGPCTLTSLSVPHWET